MQFESQALAVVAQPGGHVVLVSNGDGGLVRRDVSGRWTRIGWGAGTFPPRLSQGVVPGGSAFFSAAVVVLLLLIAGLGLTAIRAGAPWRLSRFALLFALGAGVAIYLDVLVTQWGETAHPALVIGAVVCSLVALGLGVFYAVLARRSLRPFAIALMLWLIAFVALFAESLRGAELFATLFRTGLVALGFVAVALTGLAARARQYALVAEPDPEPEVEGAS